MDTLPLEHNFNSSPANADAFTLLLYYFLLLACCSFAVVRASRRPLQTLSNAGLAVLLEEAWYTLPSPSISASLSADRRRCIHSILCFCFVAGTAPRPPTSAHRPRERGVFTAASL
jgi:hypothetical protein